MERLLLVEDDADLARLTADYLRASGFGVDVVSDGLLALERVRRDSPDGVLLDVMLPGMDGFSVCRALRPDYRGVIVMLTARGEEADEVRGLEQGADDYMAKPLRPRALLARLQALFQGRRRPGETTVLSLGRLQLDPGARRVSLDGGPLDLTTAEFDLLWVLAQRAGRIVERDELFSCLHGRTWDGVDRSIDLRVSRLRRKLGEDGIDLLKSVRGTCYLLVGS